jgi:hypothetical protein
MLQRMDTLNVLLLATIIAFIYDKGRQWLNAKMRLAAGWRGIQRIACLMGMLALLLNQLLLSSAHNVMHSLEPPEAFGASAVATHQHHEKHGSNESNDNRGQPCHFCRLMGTALPSPPTAGNVPWPTAAVASWPKTAVNTAYGQQHFTIGHPPRAPPACV